MTVFLDFLNSTFTPLLNVFASFRWTDALDIIIVAYLLYKGVALIRQTRAEQLLKGIFVFVVFYALSLLLKLNVVTYLLKLILDVAVIAIIVLFQPEIRSILEHLGRSRIGSAFSNRTEDEEIIAWRALINAVCRAAADFEEDKTGALIVIEQTTKLREIASTGTFIDAKPTEDLLKNIFFPKAALHDGATIVRDGRIYAAGCILPLTQKSDVFRNLGTRHRAAVGVSENSDAIVVVVSEETGTISVAMNGHLTRDFSSTSLHVFLEEKLITPRLTDKEGKKNIFSRMFKKRSDK
jgi:diadenylate cyclase